MAFAVRQSSLLQSFPPETLTFGSNTLSGSLLIAHVNVNDGNPVNTTAITVSDPTNGNWTQLGTAESDINNANLLMYIFYKENAGVVTSAQNVTLTVTNVGGPGADLVIIEATGLATSVSIDPSSYGSTTGDATGSLNAGTVTNSLITGVANDLYVVSFGATQTEVWATPANWTLVKQSGSIVADSLCSAVYYLTSTAQGAGTVNVTETASASTSIDSKMGAWQVPGTAYLPPPDPIYVHRRY